MASSLYSAVALRRWWRPCARPPLVLRSVDKESLEISVKIEINCFSNVGAGRFHLRVPDSPAQRQLLRPGPLPTGPLRGKNGPNGPN